MKIFRKKLMKKMYCGLPLLLLALILSACGGGSDDGATAVTYTGSSSQATLTDTNAGDLAIDAFTNGDSGTIMALGLQDSGDAGSNDSRVKNLANLFKSVVTEMEANPDVYIASNARTTVSHSETITSACGNAVYTITYDDVSLNFSGSVSFSSFCDDTTTVSGSATFSGSLNNNTFSSFTMNIISLTVTEGGVSFTASGTMTLSSDVATFTDTINVNMVMKDNSTNKTYWVKNYTITVIDNFPIDEQIEITGDFYDHDQGYVTVTTPATIIVDVGAACPSVGEIKIVGSNGFATITMPSTSGGVCTYDLYIEYTGGGTSIFPDEPWQ